ncbi:hypothetical protein HMPREF1548_02892 [Clostridium sp. KLE 1755]|nr:hypothetical protein HMPREF1548_02892 [Clostridium sp. KLE 1755]
MEKTHNYTKCISKFRKIKINIKNIQIHYCNSKNDVVIYNHSNWKRYRQRYR